MPAGNGDIFLQVPILIKWRIIQFLMAGYCDTFVALVYRVTLWGKEPNEVGKAALVANKTAPLQNLSAYQMLLLADVGRRCTQSNLFGIKKKKVY